MAVKRKLFSSSSSNTKAKQTLTTQVAKLTRQVKSATPELRQKSYAVVVNPGPAVGTGDATPLLIPSFILGDEFRLHRIHVSHEVKYNEINQWGLLYSPKQGFSEQDDLALPNAPYGQENYEYIQDQSKIRVWARVSESALAGNRRIPTNTSLRCGFFEMDKKFSIPMKCVTSSPNQTNPTVVGNQIFYGGSNRSDSVPKTLRVTIWFTDN